KVGLIKFDFLGLKTLTVIDMASRFVREAGELDFDIARIPLDDPKTFELLQRGQTVAVFQVESQGMRELLVRLKPDCFEDLIALVALYRPGPLESGMVDTYIECKHGRQPINYDLPQLEPILKETNGVILYQEQVMQIARDLAGYTLGQADMLRRAMGKKKPEEMMRQRAIFMEGAAKKRIPAAKAERIFDLMEKFAGYGFNKSHSAAYALIAWQTAWLKAHHPRAFMAATLTCDMGNSDKVAALVAECGRMDIPVLPPHVNDSDWGFRPEGDGIRFGLGAIKGVGEAVIRALVAEREANGRFESFEEMVLRAPERSLNKRILEALIKAGALDGLIPERRAAIEGLGMALERLGRRRKNFAARQNALFGAMEASDEDGALFPRVPPWNASECLQAEREALGFYLSGHPLENALTGLDGLVTANLAEITGREDGAAVVVAATVVGVRRHQGRGGTMAFVRIEDLYGQADLIVFARLYAEIADLLQSDAPLLVAARVDRSREEAVLIADSVRTIEDALPELVDGITISAPAIGWDEVTLARLKSMTGDQGRAALRFRVRLADGSLALLESARRTTWSGELRAWLAARFGDDAVRLHCTPWKPPRQARNGKGARGRAARSEG
ncbi:MAG: DNA polymerase III subunit alpha, partial [Mariprofundaceae bacterium]